MPCEEDVKVLLTKSRWTIPLDLYIGDIVEYDMSDGGFSIIKEENLLPISMIQKLEALPKGFERNEAVGKLRYSKDVSVRDTGKKLEKLFAKYRIQFADANDIVIDDVFSIKRDAVFLTRYVNQTQIGLYIKFAEKHRYDIFIRLDKLEVYYNLFDDEVSIKGIRDEIVKEYHEGFMIEVLKKYLKFIVHFDYERALSYIIDVIDKYKFKKLPIGFYREFNDSSLFSLQILGKEYRTEEAGPEVLDAIDIRYNFNKILVPMLNMASQEVSLQRNSYKNKGRSAQTQISTKDRKKRTRL